jgi:hypothetical protein
MDTDGYVWTGALLNNQCEERFEDTKEEHNVNRSFLKRREHNVNY